MKCLALMVRCIEKWTETAPERTRYLCFHLLQQIQPMYRRCSAAKVGDIGSGHMCLHAGMLNAISSSVHSVMTSVMLLRHLMHVLWMHTGHFAPSCRLLPLQYNLQSVRCITPVLHTHPDKPKTYMNGGLH
jgi:hypothetical protein